jgi:hypothetical protein
MPSPALPNELTSALEEAQELARQRELALALRDERIRLRHQHELVARRQRSRRAADLLRLADAIAHSLSHQRDYVMQPREAETSNSTLESPATPEPTQA